MTAPGWANDPFSVLVGANEPTHRAFEGDGRSAGTSVLRLDLTGVTDRRPHSEHATEEFLFLANERQASP